MQALKKSQKVIPESQKVQTTPNGDNDDRLKRQLYDKMNILAKSRFLDVFDMNNSENQGSKVNSEVLVDNLAVKDLWRWFKKLLNFYDFQVIKNRQSQNNDQKTPIQATKSPILGKNYENTSVQTQSFPKISPKNGQKPAISTFSIGI